MVEDGLYYDYGTGYTTNASTSSSTIWCEYDYADATTTGSSYKTKIISNIKYGTGNSWDDAYTLNWKTDSSSTTCGWDVYRAIEDTNRQMREFYYRWKRGEMERVPPLSPQDRLREIIQSRQSPLVIVRRTSMKSTEDIKEQRARETLRRVLGEDKFRAFLKNGFVTVRARSGLAYQIFPGHGITAVYRDGQMVERLCVVLRGQFPPTDSLIMRYLLILNDERDFRKHAISHSVSPMMKPRVAEPEQEPLTEVFRRLKVA